MTITQLDPAPLQKIVAKITATQKAIEDGKIQEKAVEKEVADYLATVDPNDKEAMRVISAKRTQLEIFPHWFDRTKKTLESLVDPLYSEIDKFTHDFLKAGCEENAALTAIYEERVDAFYPRSTKGAAGVCTAITSIPAMRIQLMDEYLANRNDGFPQMIATGLACSGKLLALYETWKKQGGRWRPEIWKRLEK